MKRLLILCLLGSALSAAESRPNVLFIAVDDMRCDLGCYGAKHVLTPNLDRLAASGVLFNRAYCQQAVCNPSRVSLMTGMRPDTTRVWYLSTEMRSVMPDAVTLPQHFRQHGYSALGFGKIFHNPWPDNVSWDEPHAWPSQPLWSAKATENLNAFRQKMNADGKPRARIDRMRAVATEVVDVPDTEHPDGAMADQALAAMRRLAGEKRPFFLAAGFVRPHLPFVVPRKYWDLYDRSKIPLATNSHLPHGAPSMAFGESQGGFYELRDYMDYAEAPWPRDAPLSEAQQRELKHGYYAAVSFTDAQVGRLLDELDRLGLASNTIVVFWSDHGWKLGEHGGWCKQTNYEIDTRAPLMIRMPGAKANGTSTNALVEFVDIYPTLAELAGLPVSGKLEGTSLKPLLTGTASQVKDAAFSQFPRREKDHHYMGYAMRTDRHRYIEWLDLSSREIVAQELYDHTVDPDENENIATRPDQAALLAQLNAQLWKTLPRPAFNWQEPASAASTASTTSLPWHPAADGALPKSDPQGPKLAVTFQNQAPQAVDLIWVSNQGEEKHFKTLEPKDVFSIRSSSGALWLVKDAQHHLLGHFQIQGTVDKPVQAVIPAP
ncbi:sulfatase-like hydrolase/transferase [Prosthecobacter sp.]|uniref:sulfatase-like hydrolase/transferase n=1 Tax=Prosthecobacter sp. TaxID=1965333 RepID=UPI003782F270